MKTRSLAIDLLLLASIFLSTNCAAPTPAALPTPPATQTLAPTATQTTVPTETPTATKTPISAEFIPLNVKSTEFSETKEGVTTNIVLSMDASMKMRPVGEKADEFVKNTNFPGGANEAMNAYARGLLYETAILTNENAKGMTEDEYLEALAFAQENPDNEEAWKKVEINIYDNATKTMKKVRFTTSTTLELVFVNYNLTNGLVNTYNNKIGEGIRVEVDKIVDTIRIIRGLENDDRDTTAYVPFTYHMAGYPKLIAAYKGEVFMHKKQFSENKKLRSRIAYENTGRCAFKVYFDGQPASPTEKRSNY